MENTTFCDVLFQGKGVERDNKKKKIQKLGSLKEYVYIYLSRYSDKNYIKLLGTKVMRVVKLINGG